MVIIITLSCGVGCNVLQSDNADLDVHEHDFSVQTIAPTCTTAGYDLYTCSCKEEYIKNIVQSLGHEFAEYHSDKNATYDKDGTKTAKCNRKDCTATDTVVDGGSRLKKDYTVTLKFNNGEKDQTFTTLGGKPFSTPNSPSKNNYIFTGWIDDKTGKKYDFSQSVDSDITLSAEYQIDALTITNTITTDTIKSVVKIYNKRYNTGYFGVEKDVSLSQGSGFCFEIQNGIYYVLTNSHVVYKETNFSYQDLTIEDYAGNTYTAYLYKNPNKEVSAICADYDLACIYFTPTSTQVKELAFDSGNYAVDNDIIVLGAPKGQTNAITFGKVKEYCRISLSNITVEESNVVFDVMRSTAKANSGSSGGPALNAQLQVVGVTYAGDTEGDSYQIPLLKVKEFLSLYVYS